MAARRRPDGSGQIQSGIALCVGAAVLLIIACLIDTRPYGSIDPDAASLRMLLILLSISGLGLSFLLLATGWIIGAMSFLPGQDDQALAPLDLDPYQQSTPPQSDPWGMVAIVALGGIAAVMAAVIFWRG